MSVGNDLVDVALLSVGVAVLSVILWFLHRNGAFCVVDPRELEIGPAILAYTTHVGPYKNIGQVQDRMEALFKARGVTEKPVKESPIEELRVGQLFGLYMDDPKITKKEDLRAMIGVVLDVGEKVDEQRRKLWQTRLKDDPEIVGVEILEKTDAIVAEFPCHSALSLLLSIRRVYPKLNKAMPESRQNPKTRTNRLIHNCFEFYSTELRRTVFAAPVTARGTLLPFELKKTK